MQLPLKLNNGDDLEFKPGFPMGYKGIRLAGAKISYVKTNTISIVSQLIHSDLFFIQYTISRFLEKVSTIGWFDSRGLYIRFQLKNSQRHLIGRKKLHLRQDQCTGIWMMKGECKSLFVPKNEYQSLDIFISPQLLSEYESVFPELKKIVQKQKPDWVTGNKCWIIPAMHKVLDDLLDCPFDAETGRLYYELKVREIITHLLHYRFKRTISLYKFSPWELKKIMEAKELLHDYINEKPPTLHALAVRVNLAELKLKTGFLYMFNCTILEWLIDAKMKKAKELLLNTNEPVKELCIKVGYPRVSNFITAFRRKYGRTPGSFRRF